MKRGSTTLRSFITKRKDIGGQDTNHGNFNDTSKNDKGQFVRIRLKTGDKTYVGDVFLPENFSVSDLMNDSKHFIILANAVEEGPIKDEPMGSLAFNKTMTQWVELEAVKKKRGVTIST